MFCGDGSKRCLPSSANNTLGDDNVWPREHLALLALLEDNVSSLLNPGSGNATTAEEDEFPN